MQSKDSEAPRLVVFSEDDEAVINNIKSTFIVADTIVIETGADMKEAILSLLGVYYVCCMEYPKLYSQILGLLQTYIVGNMPFDKKTSAKYKSFVSKLNNHMN